MENELKRYLNHWYYGMLALTVIAATIMYLLIMKDMIAPIDHLSTVGQVIQYIAIFNVLTSVPLGLYGFKMVCKKLPEIEDETAKLAKYKEYAVVRIVLVSSSMTVGIVAFYLLGCYMSMFWIAAIGAIGWYFTKPTEKKIYLEMHPDNQQETY